MKKAAICGYFSLPYRTNTVGDILAQMELEKYLTDLGYHCDIILADSLNKVKPSSYHVMFFVCGPLVDTDPFKELLHQFESVKKIAVNVSVLENHRSIVEQFDGVICRDSIDETNYDLSLGVSASKKYPVVGLIFAGLQREYLCCECDKVNQIVTQVLDKLNYPHIRIDTKLPNNDYELKSITDVESVISKMDFIITTRLHGAILSLRNDIPFIAIDQIIPEAKLSRQMQKIGWPYIFNVATLNSEDLIKAIRSILSDKAQELVCQKHREVLSDFFNNRTAYISRLEHIIND